MQLQGYLIASKTAALLGQGNKEIYDDIYWQFLAYAYKGYPQMKDLFTNKQLTQTQLDIWKLADDDDWAGAGLDIAENEQLGILQPLFDQMSPLASMAAADKSKPLFPGATPFKDVGSNLANKKQRWDGWIVPYLWPEWVAFSGNAKNEAWIKKTMDNLKNPNR